MLFNSVNGKCRLNIFILIFGLIFSLDSLALEYHDFPENLQWVLDDRLEELEEKPWFCIAGRVTLEDGKKIYDSYEVDVHYSNNVSIAIPVYYDGWFIMRKVLDREYEDRGKTMSLRAWGYDPLNEKIDPQRGEITYLEFQMKKNPEDQLCIIRGQVFDENNNPVEGAEVSLGPTHCHFEKSELKTFSDTDGSYFFDSIASAKYRIKASKAGYAYYDEVCNPYPQIPTVINPKLYPHRRIYIKYVYQPDDTHVFVGENLISKTFSWKHDNTIGRGLRLSDGIITKHLNDITLVQSGDVLRFNKYYSTRKHQNGFYDAGLVGFDSVMEADLSKDYRGLAPCIVGHVYVIRTVKGPRYAKLIVLSDEYSFRTVNPDYLQPFEFKGYDLTVDVTSCRDVGKIYVSKYFHAPDGLDVDYLPYYWEITGLEECLFSADLTFEYNEDDLKRMNLSEAELTVYQYNESSESWLKLPTRINSKKNNLHVKKIKTCSQFAIGVD